MKQQPITFTQRILFRLWPNQAIQLFTCFAVCYCNSKSVCSKLLFSSFRSLFYLISWSAVAQSANLWHQRSIFGSIHCSYEKVSFSYMCAGWLVVEMRSHQKIHLFDSFFDLITTLKNSIEFPLDFFCLAIHIPLLKALFLRCTPYSTHCGE